jgi:uncharacterized iron-regulated protein
MKILLIVVFTALCGNVAIAQDKPAYVLYNKNGKKVTYKKMVKLLAQKDVVFFGELHNNPIAHWLQLELSKSLHEKRRLVMGAEMFESDNQQALTSYLEKKITAKGLDSAARLWNNYSTDYAPLVNFAKANQIQFIATNIPRRYASMVSRAGFDTLQVLSDTEKKWLAPLPVKYDSTLPGYVKMINMMPGHSSTNFPKAQAIKDATMAYFIAREMQPGFLFLHFNGAYHSDNNEGITWYLRNAKPGVQVGTITTVSQQNNKALLKENKLKADFIICVDEDMTTTY